MLTLKLTLMLTLMMTLMLNLMFKFLWAWYWLWCSLKFRHLCWPWHWPYVYLDVYLDIVLNVVLYVTDVVLWAIIDDLNWPLKVHQLSFNTTLNNISMSKPCNPIDSSKGEGKNRHLHQWHFSKKGQIFCHFSIHFLFYLLIKRLLSS